MPLTTSLGVLLGAWVLGWIGTALARRIALRLGFVNHPNPIIPDHRSAVAYMGGVGILFGAYLALLATGLLAPSAAPATPLFPWSLLVGGLLFGGIGLADDRLAFSSKQKFLLHVSAVTVVMLLGEAQPGGSLIHTVTGVRFIDALFCGLWIISVVNAINLIDVCDGLAGSVAAATFAGFVIAFSPYPLVAAALAGACLGFLMLNRPPAKIYMGDAGSNFLGFMLGALICSESSGAGVWPWLPMMTLWAGVPFFELIFLAAIRRKKGLVMTQGSPDHFALRLQRAGFSKWQVDGIAVLHVAWFWGMAALIFVAPSWLMQVGLSLFMVAMGAWIWLYLIQWDAPPAPKLEVEPVTPPAPQPARDPSPA